MSRAIPPKLRFEIFKRDGFACTYCGRGAPDVILVIDHSVPFAAGGDSAADNLATSCRDCNSGKSDVPLSAVLLVIKSPERVKAAKRLHKRAKAVFLRVPGTSGRGGLREPPGGRPRKESGQNKVLSGRVPPELHAAALAHVDATQTTVSQLVEVAVREFLERATPPA